MATMLWYQILHVVLIFLALGLFKNFAGADIIILGYMYSSEDILYSPGKYFYAPRYSPPFTIVIVVWYGYVTSLEGKGPRLLKYMY